MRTTSAGLMWCGGPSSRRLPGSIPAGYASHTGYQYDSISRVAGQREPAPPSKFSNDGGFRNSVFNGILGISILTLLDAAKDAIGPARRYQSGTSRASSKAWKPLSKFALARLKRQNNLAERRYSALSRENRGLAGYRMEDRRDLTSFCRWR